MGMLRLLDVTTARTREGARRQVRDRIRGYGNIVLVQVTPQVVTLCAHLASYRVHAGEAVRRGELLGIAGCTGYCTDTHLHFEVRENGVAIDPRQFLSG